MLQQLDTSKIRIGRDGLLIHEGVPFLEVNTFNCQINFTNSDYTPARSNVTHAIPGPVTITLTFTQAYVNDRLPDTILKSLKAGRPVAFDFQGQVERDDGEFVSQSYRQCYPDGAIDLLNVRPGEIIERNFSFRVNQIPELDNPIL